ncbi:hypothetical protein [Marinobacter xestospongiae]|uniref:hypothetical protein n=1 Tax=Marinobacter xestospongiae TaxID=994319 RepID=UPI002005085F|nr:hypothetical protein [Marinobacter xestospongiae]MCK7565546.1 hypothetical protein [Marinobacter xestospongiae]
MSSMTLSQKTLPILATLLAAGTLHGCGGSSDDDSNTNPPEPETRTGIFVDSPVINIGYRTDSQAGTTNELGEFKYLEGEMVTFFIGDLEFPTVPASAVVTPLDLAGTNDTHNQAVTNMVRLLQSLDEDGDPDNGIVIPEGAAANSLAVDFSVDPGQFVPLVTNLVANSGSATTSLVAEAEARDHFEEQLVSYGVTFGTLDGLWRLDSDGDDLTAVAFMSDGYYIFTNYNSQQPDSENGMEQGNYALDSGTGELTTTQLYDLNPGYGLSEDIGHFARVYGDKLHLIFDDNGDGLADNSETVIFSRVTSDQEVGLWEMTTIIGENVTGDDKVNFMFFNDGRYIHSEYGPEIEAEEAGVELGNYTIDPVTDQLSVSALLDRNDGRGLSAPGAEPFLMFATVDGDQLSLVLDDNENEVIDEGDIALILSRQ